LPLSVYASLNYSEWDEKFNFPFGVNVNLLLQFSLRQIDFIRNKVYIV